MPLVQVIWAWVLANPGMALAIGAAIYAFLTKKITLQGLIQTILEDIKVVVKPNDPTPPGPDQVKPDVAALLQELIQLLLKAKAEKDPETEAAVLKVMASYGK